jgi:hypothetical protein
MVTTALGAQYLQGALAKWREANPWASHIPWEHLPQRYKDEMEMAARLTMFCGRNTVAEVVNLAPDAEVDDLAA